MRFATLPEWLAWLEHHHPRAIELGLERVGAVARRMALGRPAARVISVAGTNGKGSCVAAMDALLRAQGCRVGCYTSPHLLRYNERVVIDGETVSDASLCEAFAAVDAARDDISLTYFEFGTLAALWLFERAGLDVALLEVGLGGRLDAVNIVDADVSVVTSIDLDHQDWLGADRDSIGREKAGIFRRDCPAVYGDADPAQGLLDAAAERGCQLLCREQVFSCARDAAGTTWSWWGRDGAGQALRWDGLALPGVSVNSVATAIQAVFSAGFTVTPEQVAALAELSLPGRFQREDCAGVEIIFDVAHNPAAARELATRLAALPPAGRQAALFAIMADKDLPGVVQPLQPHISAWFLADLPQARALPAHDTAAALNQQGVHMISVSKNIRQAWRRVLSLLVPGDRLLVYGSFFTVAEALQCLARDRQRSATDER